MSTFTVRMNLERSTPGALLYREVDTQNKPIPQSVGRLNSMYVRKIGLPDTPQVIEVTVKSL